MSLKSYANNQLIKNKILFDSNTSITLQEKKIKEAFSRLKKEYPQIARELVLIKGMIKLLLLNNNQTSFVLGYKKCEEYLTTRNIRCANYVKIGCPSDELNNISK